MPAGWVYIMTSRPNGILCTGVTTNLAKRVWEHREGTIDGFIKQHGLRRLVYAEPHEGIRVAIQGERALKRWPPA